MGDTTAIGWTDATFNPWWGCEHVSPGCDHCYAERDAKRYGHRVWGQHVERRLLGEETWKKPVRWNREAEAAGVRRLVFCASMADVFEDRDELAEPRARLFELMTATPWLVWQVLTKRPQNVEAMVPSSWTDDSPYRWPSNVWIGTTVEDQERADERVPILIGIEGPQVRFLSCEPLLGPVVLRPEWIDLELQSFGANGARCFPRVDWIIAGGESGPRHRPLDLDHARALRDQALAADVPFFFKQVGGPQPTSGGDELDGMTWKMFPPTLTAVHLS